MSNKTCLTCTHYNFCTDPDKSFGYKCSSYKKIAVHNIDSYLDDLAQEYLGDNRTVSSGLILPNTVDPVMSDTQASKKERQLISYLDDVLENPNPIPRDLKFDDSDLKEFPNFYEWCMAKDGANTPPFARQLAIGIHLFGEWCLHGDSVIPTEKGLLKLRDVCGNPKTKGMNAINLKVGTLEGSAYVTWGGMTSKRRKCLKITSGSGLPVIVTPEHKMAVLNPDYTIGWKQAKDLTNADILVSALGRNLWAKKMVTFEPFVDCYTRKLTNNEGISFPKRCTKDLAYLLGAVLGDGEFSTGKTSTGYTGVSFCNADKNVVDRYVQAIKNSFNVTPHIVKTKTNTTFGTGRDFWYVSVHSVAMVEFLRHIGVKPANSYDKEIPDFILQSPKAVVLEFLAGLLDTDGYVSQGRIGIGLNNEKIIQGLSNILTNLGVYHVVEKKFIDPTDSSHNVKFNRTTGLEDYRNYRYNLEVHQRASLIVCAKIIPLAHKVKKSQALTMSNWDNYIPKFSSTKKSYREGVMPFGREFYLAIRNKQDYYNEPNVPSLKRASSFYFANLKSNSEELSYIKTRLPDYYKNLKLIEKRRLVFSHVASIEDAGYHEVYDITVPRGENFIANGLVVHNCPRCSHEKFQSIYTVPYRASPQKVAENAVFLEYGICPKCGVRKSELIKTGELPLYDELASCLGQRGGKSAMFSIMSPYITHKYLKLQNPNRLFGLMENTVLSATFVGLTFARAMSLLWTPIHNLMTSSQWYVDYHDLMKQYENKYGVVACVVKDTYIDYRHRRLRLYASGPSKRTLRGDCFVGNTLINTNQGFVELKEVISNTGFNESKGITIDSPLGFKEVSHTLKVKRKTVQLKTRNGYKVECTPEEPLLVMTPELQFKWVKVKNLTVGDFIISRTNLNAPSYGNSTVSLDQARIMGYMLANGCGSRPEFSSGVKAVIKKFSKAIFNETGKYPKQHGDFIEGVGVPNWTFSYTYYREVLNELGYSPTNAYDKEIPYSIRTAPKKILHEFLECYFQCDCGVNGGATKKKGSMGLEVELCTASKKLCDQLHVILLQAYGIVARRELHEYTIWTGKDVKYHVLTITGYDASLFLKTFKRAKAHNYSHRFNNSEIGLGSDRRLIPYLRRYLANIYESARAPVTMGSTISKYLITNKGERVLNNIRPRCFNKRSCANITGTKQHVFEGLFYNDNLKLVLGRIKQLDVEAYNRLTKLIQLHPLFEEIVSLEYTNTEKWVYDVTVPDGHSFTANGIAAHNTRYQGGIDEAGWFYSGGDDDEERERASGKEVHGALDRSLKTVRMSTKNLINKGYDNIISAYNMSISSPSNPNDLIMYLTTLYENSNQCLAVRLPTWKFNPLYRSRDDFKKEYAENYARAERDFGANPIVNENKAYSQEEVMNIFRSTTGNNLFEITTKAVVNKDVTYTKPKLMKLLVNNFPSVLSLDAGVTNNSFALTLTQKTPAGIRTTGVIEIQPIKGTVINFNHTYTEIIKPICEKLNVCGVITDRWQSIAILHRIEEELEIKTYTLTARAGHFTVFDSYHRPDPMVSYPKPEIGLAEIFEASDDYRVKFHGKPVAHLVHQFNTVQDINGVYDKGINQTDDLLRAAVLGVNLITDAKFVDKYLKERERKEMVALGTVGSMGTYVSPNALDANSNIGISSGTTPAQGIDVGSMMASRFNR